LAGASHDTVRIWDTAAHAEVIKLTGFRDSCQSIAWSGNGRELVCTSKDKLVRLFDPRAGTEATAQADAHGGMGAMRTAWLGDSDRFLTTGFSKTRERQVAIWDARALTTPLHQLTIDSSTGPLTPLFDGDANLLFLGGKGDTSIRFFEVNQDKPVFTDGTWDLVHACAHSSL
jgi:WD40 repeat protein